MRHVTRLLAVYLLLLFAWHLTRLPLAFLLGYLAAGVLWALGNHYVVWRYQPDHPWHDISEEIMSSSAKWDLLGGVVEGIPLWLPGAVLTCGILLAVGAARLVRR